MSVVTLSISRLISSTQSLEDAHKGMMCVHTFIGMCVHVCIQEFACVLRLVRR